MTRTLQNLWLFFGVLRLRGRVEPVRTRSLVLSKLPRALTDLLTSSRLSRLLYLIGLERYEQAGLLIEASKLSAGQLALARGAMQIGRGYLSSALTTLETATLASAKQANSRLTKRLVTAAKSELEYLRHSASGEPEAPDTTPGSHRAKPTPSQLRRDWPVLHVLGTSLPHTHAGYTMRTQFLLSAINSHGVACAGVTRLLYPVDRGVLAAKSHDQIDSVTYLRELPIKAPAGRTQFHQDWAACLADIARSTRARLLQPTTDFTNGRAALKVAADLALPVVYEVRGFLEESASVRQRTSGAPNAHPSQRYELSRQAETRVMLEADAVTTLSETMKQEICSRGVRSDKVHVMPNGVSTDLLTMQTDSTVLRSQLGISPSDFIIGVITTFSAHEGLPTLVHAMKSLKERSLPIKCVLVGDGPVWRSINELVTDQGLGDVIYLPGRVETQDVAQWYQLLDLFVLPRVDARVTQLVTPLKPLEAMALGVPVAGSAVGGVTEVISEGLTGAVFAPDDPLACANKIEELLYDSTTRNALAGAGRAWVSEERTWAKIAERYVALYQELGAI